eukprot:6439449-Prymnesium_polylepis.1
MAKRNIDGDEVSTRASTPAPGPVIAVPHESKLLPATLLGVVVASVGPLIYEETGDYTFWLSPKAFKSLVEEAGGAVGGAINGKTNLLVHGLLDRMYTKKEPDTFTGGGVEAALLKQLATQATPAGRKSGPLAISSFDGFCEYPRRDSNPLAEGQAACGQPSSGGRHHLHGSQWRGAQGAWRRAVPPRLPPPFSPTSIATAAELSRVASAAQANFAATLHTPDRHHSAVPSPTSESSDAWPQCVRWEKRIGLGCWQHGANPHCSSESAADSDSKKQAEMTS